MSAIKKQTNLRWAYANELSPGGAIVALARPSNFRAIYSAMGHYHGAQPRKVSISYKDKFDLVRACLEGVCE